MSFTVDGMTFTPDYKAKEKRLYQIIASRDDEVRALKQDILERETVANQLSSELSEVRDELRALKAKERRRATKRKKGREQPGD